MDQHHLRRFLALAAIAFGITQWDPAMIKAASPARDAKVAKEARRQPGPSAPTLPAQRGESPKA